MKGKTVDIDILEEKEKEAIKDLEEYLHWEELQGFSMLPRDKHIETLLNLVSNLISENKELKEKNNELEEEDVKIRAKFILQLDNYILKSKVEELLKEIENRNYNDYTGCQDGNEVKYNILLELQSLLGKE